MATDPASTLISILVAGDSHVMGYKALEGSVSSAGRSFKVALKSAHLGGAYIALDLVVTFPDGRSGINPSVERALAGAWPGLDLKGHSLTPGLRPAKHLVLSLGTGLSANDPTMSTDDRETNGLFFRHGFDFILPSHPTLDVDMTTTIIPVAVVRSLYERALNPLRLALAHFATLYSGRLWLVCAPPPPVDNAKKVQLVASRAAALSSEEVRLPTPIVSLKLWLLVRQVVKTVCAEVGCRFIDCAPTACEPEGYLRSEFVSDGFHGNERYNQLMANHVVSTVAAAESSFSEVA